MDDGDVSRHDLYIDGEFVEPIAGRSIRILNPADGTPWADIADAGHGDVDRAVEAARRAFEGAWGATSPASRARLMNRLADAIEARADRLAEIDVKETGRPLAGAAARFATLASWYRYYAGLADKIEGRTMSLENPSLFNFTLREPLGVTAHITPSNGTLLVLAFTMAPALAAGNTVVVKPSETASVSALEFARCIEEAGFPKGVYNVLTGRGAVTGAALAAHEDVARLAFTGSHATGVRVAQLVAEHCGTVMLELSGKSPNIVFADAPLDAAIGGLLQGIFTFSGQMCVAGSRALVQRKIYDEVVERLVAGAEAIRVGHPGDASSHAGPLAGDRQLRRVEDYVEIAKAEGARLVCGGVRAEVADAPNGFYYRPTIFAGVDSGMRIAREEVFGPLLAVIPFDTEADALRIANDTSYGLGAGVWTQDSGRAIRMARGIKAGTVYVNMYLGLSCQMPFGGYKQSGVGRENGQAAILDWTQTKSVWMETSPVASGAFGLRL